jgi:hypothetical protein
VAAPSVAKPPGLNKRVQSDFWTSVRSILAIQGIQAIQAIQAIQGIQAIQAIRAIQGIRRKDRALYDEKTAYRALAVVDVVIKIRQHLCICQAVRSDRQSRDSARVPGGEEDPSAESVSQ